MTTINPKFVVCCKHRGKPHAFRRGCNYNYPGKKRKLSLILEEADKKEKAIKEFTKNNPYYTVKKGGKV